MSELVENQIVRESLPGKAPLWEVRGIFKAFPGVQALDDVSMEVYAGEVHALLGENGSGKSTLAKCIAGVYQPDLGEILFKGKPVNFRHPMEARAAGVATIYQEFSLVPTLTVAENIYLGRYPHNPAAVIDWSAVQKGTLNVLEQLSLSINPDEVVKNLSVAEQQLVEIVKAISLESNLLIMDEPTAALGLIETQHLMELIRRLTAQGKAIIYISHRLDEVFQIADRVTILKDGKHITTAPISDLHMSEVVRLMVGFDIQQHYPKEKNAQPSVCLEVENLSTENGVNDVSFSINVGEVFGLGGMLGSGRTEIARALYGLDRVTSGKIRLYKQEVRFASPSEAVKSGVGLVPENRKSDGCFFNFEAPKNITISRLKDLLRGPFLNLGAERKVGEAYVRRMNIHPTALEKSVQFLSGGNQQKVIVARWLYSQARLLIMDEPTQGIDVGAKLEVYNVINELTRTGISILLISSDFPELLAMTDRVAVVRDGRVLHITESQRMTEYQLIGMVSGVGLSEEIEQWMQLRKIALPYLQALQDLTHATVHLAVLDRREMALFYLDKVGYNATTMVSRSGASGPLHCTGLGKTLLAYETPEKIREWMDKESLPSFTEHTITDQDNFLAEMQTIRKQGFGLELEEHELGVNCIAAPIKDSWGQIKAAISLSGPANVMPDDLASSHLREELIETAEKISRDFIAKVKSEGERNG
jgi:ribose transport system ATP-binding protein